MHEDAETLHLFSSLLGHTGVEIPKTLKVSKALMARKIEFIDNHEHIKKSVAVLLIRRQVAEWVVRNVSIRLRSDQPQTLPRVSPAASHYIPETLPPPELPGVTCTTDKGSEKRSLLIRARLFANSCQ